MLHVDDGQLHAYLDGELELLGPAETQAIEQHLDACAECRARLEEERRLRERAGLILRGSEAVELPVPAFETIAARAGGGPTQRPAPRPRRPAALLAWAASILLALGLGWYGRELMLTTRDLAMESAEPETVAAAAPEPREAAPSPAAPAPPERTETVAAADVPPPRAPARPGPAGDVATRAAPVEPLSAPARATAPPPPAEVTVAEAAPAAPAAERPEPVADALAEGRVTTAAGAPVAGAQVVIRGTSIGTLTRPDGSYSLAVPPGRLPAAGELEIAVQSIGFASEARTVPLKPGATVAQNFELRPVAVALEAVVVTGTSAEAERRQGVAVPAAESAAAAGEIRWQPVSRAEASRRLGGPLRLVPGLRVIGITAGMQEGEPVIRTIQQLAEGGWLELLQRRETREMEAAYAGRAARPRARAEAAAAAPTPAARDLADDESEGIATVSIQRDGFRITARAPVSPDTLRALVAKLR